MSHGLHCWPQLCPSPGLSVAPMLGLARDPHPRRGSNMCPRPSWGIGLAGGCPAKGSRGWAPLHTLGMLEAPAGRGDELTGYSRLC